jgi:hypothetical protein
MTQKRNQVLLHSKQRTAVALLDVYNHLGISVNANIVIDLGLEFMSMANSGNEEFQKVVKSKFDEAKNNTKTKNN